MIVFGNRIFWQFHIFQKWIRKGIIEEDIEIFMIKLIWKLLIQKDRDQKHPSNSRTKFLPECTLQYFFLKRQIFISTFYSSSLRIKSEIMAHLEMPRTFFILHFGRSNCSFGRELQHCVHKFEGLWD